ncbi:MAG: hypothetical protein M3R17_16055 [Bacteroidota bacterium]|nr:hypothetical protein [Bacteroidota bacterium]
MPLQNTIAIKRNNTIHDLYIPLTDQDSLGILIKKLLEKKADTSDFWATLGRQDNASVTNSWAGAIVCSKVGNNSFTDRGRKIREEAQQLCELYSDVNPDVTTVTEKFIALKDLVFSDLASRKVRLTITLDDGEHALTFLQHTELTDTKSQDGVFEYILPETVDAVGKKDRITYLFDVPEKSVDGPFQTVVKVMTFKSAVTLKSTVGDVKDKLRSLDNPYDIKIFDAAANKFISYYALTDQEKKTKFDTNKKTLLLIHGTISSIAKSYGDLYDSGKSTAADTKHDWLQKDVLGGKKYEQIIGFDHPSIVDSPQQNADKLFSMLAPLGTFSKTVDIITTSRGGLVGKCVINQKQNIFKVERAVTLACANGVELLNTGQALGRMLGIIRLIDQEPVSKAGLLLLQLVVKVALAQPGIKIMSKNDPDLKTLLATPPADKNTRYLPLCGDYKLDGNHPAVWKFADLLLCGLMKDGHHDWVVESDFQVIMPAGYYAYQQSSATYRSLTMDTTHLRYFYDPMNTKAKTRIMYYLHDADVISAKGLPGDF